MWKCEKNCVQNFRTQSMHTEPDAYVLNISYSVSFSFHAGFALQLWVVSWVNDEVV